MEELTDEQALFPANDDAHSVVAIAALYIKNGRPMKGMKMR
jgi:hypothetical protein